MTICLDMIEMEISVSWDLVHMFWIHEWLLGTQWFLMGIDGNYRGIDGNCRKIDLIRGSYHPQRKKEIKRERDALKY